MTQLATRTQEPTDAPTPIENAPAAVDVTCPHGHPECNGVSGLYFGELSCFECWMDAPEDALAASRGEL